MPPAPPAPPAPHLPAAPTGQPAPGVSGPPGSPSTPTLTREEVAHLARLARIELTDAELDHLAPQLEVILGAVARVGELSSADVPPTSHPLPLSNVFRSDEVRPGLSPEQALAGAPAVQDQRFRVPRILGEEA